MPTIPTCMQVPIEMLTLTMRRTVLVNKQPKNICEEAKKKCIYIVLVDQPHTISLIDNLQ